MSVQYSGSANIVLEELSDFRQFSNNSLSFLDIFEQGIQIKIRTPQIDLVSVNIVTSENLPRFLSH